MKIIEGGICAVEQVKASGVRKGKYGLGIILNPNSNAAGVFTSNKVVAAPVKLTKKALINGTLSAVVVNSGNANCFTGAQGVADAKEMSKKVATHLKIDYDDVGVGSTGVIGREMPMETINNLIDHAIDPLENSAQASKNAAKAIMTTDTFFKEFAVETKLTDGSNVKIGGIAKGSGMIAPNMGTMLCFITSDVKASPQELQESLQKAVNQSFNMVVVDGDESTNDMVVIMANGKSGKIDVNFQKALDFLCQELAKMMARDGEGATKFMEVEIKNARSNEDAQNAAKSVVKSPLVKTALFGGDPNWGRIVAAVGYSGAEMKEDKISVTLQSPNENVTIVYNGIVKAFENTEELKIAENIMKQKEIKIIVDLSLDKYSATAYGCDLSYDYVKINAEYTT
ncbi:bifunctional ornithine acetyltransferase/N-acetylglutamate synthase [Methanobacterium alcaliphilum]|uniref:bifunctional ornithine acetyltransferase/N-acetylglutamate synthase n=1 Tax=Methanobacterium alcaliphilum TaxID=392018 RepID=UPI00200A2316|nr:bifunctional ornithine acetyltransferase/N-acetylglutamate synthase [Methanobacterium alcaliphilum]MCK9151624.1 bifunctional ornithine acetyltransferase/N-acetylglutamate synthase [Methanobacterium alcaliphilum]